MRFTSTMAVLGLLATGSLALPQPQTADASYTASSAALATPSGTDLPTPPSGAPTPPSPPGNGTAGPDNSTLPLCGPPAPINGTDGGNGTMPMPPLNATVPGMLNGTLTGNMTMINATMPGNGTCMPPPPPGNGTGPAGGPAGPPDGGPAAPSDSPTASATDSAPTSSSSG